SSTRFIASSIPRMTPLYSFPSAVITDTGFPTNAFSSSPNLRNTNEDNFLNSRANRALLELFECEFDEHEASERRWGGISGGVRPEPSGADPGSNALRGGRLISP